MGLTSREVGGYWEVTQSGDRRGASGGWMVWEQVKAPCGGHAALTHRQGPPARPQPLPVPTRISNGSPPTWVNLRYMEITPSEKRQKC